MTPSRSIALRHGGSAMMTLVAIATVISMSAAAQSGPSPILLLPPGQVVPLPPRGTPSEMPLPDYDGDEDRRNEWSKKEFPHLGECRWMPLAWGGKPPMRRITTVAETQAIQRSLEQVIGFLKTAPVADPPFGICPWVVAAGSDEQLDEGFALRSSFWVANWPGQHLSRNKPGGRIVKGYTLGHLQFFFNTLPGHLISPRNTSGLEMADAQGEFFPAGQPIGLFQGFPAYFALSINDEGYLVIPRNNRPLFRPVRLDRMMRWQLIQLDKEIKQIRSAIDNARTEYDGFFGPTAQADEERIIARRIENERARTPEAQARIRANRQAEMRERTEALRARWDVAAIPDHPLNLATRRKAAAESRLVSLSATEAQAPACLIDRERGSATPGLATSGNPDCSIDLVERNPDFYDRSLPRTALQILVIGRFSWVAPAGGLPGSRYRYLFANRHMLWGLDWQKFRSEVLGAPAPFDIATVAPYSGTPRPLPPDAMTGAPRATVASPDSPALAPASAMAMPAEEFRTRGPVSTEKPSIEMVLPVYRTDQLVEVRYSGMSGEQRDWLAIAPAGAPIEQYGEWTYLDGKRSGTHKFSRLLKPGQYEVRAFDYGAPARKGNAVKARAEFIVR